MSDLLITGGNGLLGSALKALCPDAIFVTSQDADLRDLRQVRDLFQKIKPSRVLHLAAMVGGVHSNAVQNADLFTNNIQINTNVLSVAHEIGVNRLISILSSCAFELHPDRPSLEEDLHQGEPFPGNLGYGYSKRMLDIQTKILWEQYKCRFSTITPVTMYGPNDNFNLEDGHVIGSLIHRGILAKEQRERLVVWGSGQALRQFVYVGDIAKLLVQMLAHYEGPDTIIIAPYEGITIEALVKRIIDNISYKGDVKFDQKKPEGVLVKRLSSDKFSRHFPEFKFTPLQEGLKDTIKWFQENRREEVST